MLIRRMAGLLLVVVIGGCGARTAAAPADELPAGPSTSAAVPTVSADQRVVAVYAAAIRHHLTTVGEPIPPTVYVLERAVPDAANAMRPLDDESGVAIDVRVREQLVLELADLAAVTFIASPLTVLAADQDCPTVNDRGVVVTLAPVPVGGDRVELGLAEFRNCLNARWQTYVLTHKSTGWTVDGTTGPMAIA